MSCPLPLPLLGPSRELELISHILITPSSGLFVDLGTVHARASLWKTTYSTAYPCPPLLSRPAQPRRRQRPGTSEAPNLGSQMCSLQPDVFPQGHLTNPMHLGIPHE